MKIHKDITQGTDEWFALRLAKFTASDAQAIANNGAGLTTLVYEKVAEKLTGKTKEAYTNEEMERGKELEAMARDSYEMETGSVAQQVGFIEVSELIGCSPDGLILDKGMLEIKCPNDVNFVRSLYEGKIDTKYLWQIQMQMLVAEREWVDFVLFNPNFTKSISIKRINRDEEAVGKLKIGLTSAESLFYKILKNI